MSLQRTIRLLENFHPDTGTIERIKASYIPQILERRRIILRALPIYREHYDPEEAEIEIEGAMVELARLRLAISRAIARIRAHDYAGEPGEMGDMFSSNGGDES